MDWLFSMNWTLHNYEDVRNLALLLAAVIGLPLAIWRSAIAHKQVRIAEDNHVAEMYTKAIDQLGRKEDEIRLGGLYALEKIAKINHQYYSQIMEVLCVFVRMHAPNNKKNGEENPDDKDRKPNLIIQTALTIIGRRKAPFWGIYGMKKIIVELFQWLPNRLQFSWIKKFVYPDPHFLVVIDLSNSNLEYTSLIKANLQSAIFQDSNLDGVRFTGVNLSGAYCKGASLRNAWLVGNDINSMYLESANLEGAVINSEELQKAMVFKNTKLPDHIDRGILRIFG